MREEKKKSSRGMQHLFFDATSVYRWCTADSDVAAVRVCVSVYIDSSTVVSSANAARDLPCAGCVGDSLRHHLEY